MKSLEVNNDIIVLRHGDLAFKDNKIYCRVNHTINHKDMHDADFSIEKSKVSKIVVDTLPYIIKTINGEYHIGKTRTFYSIPENISHITCTNLICKINKYIPLLKKNDVYAEIGVKFGAAASGVLQYSINNNLNLSINLFEKDSYCCRFLYERFEDKVNIIEGNAAETLNTLDTKFDFVFFDAHHHYKDDYPILQALIPHLKESSVILFDDYIYSPDVRELVNEFKNNYNFPNIYTI